MTLRRLVGDDQVVEVLLRVLEQRDELETDVGLLRRVRLVEVSA